MISATERSMQPGAVAGRAAQTRTTASPAPKTRASGGAAEQQSRKTQALQRLPGLKQNIAIVSVAAFSVFSLLVGSHQIGSSGTSTAASASQSVNGAQAQSSQGSSGYLGQNQGSYGFGSGGSSPVAGSGTS
jgi:hypothetical protein